MHLKFCRCKVVDSFKCIYTSLQAPDVCTIKKNLAEFETETTFLQDLPTWEVRGEVLVCI